MHTFVELLKNNINAVLMDLLVMEITMVSVGLY